MSFQEWFTVEDLNKSSRGQHISKEVASTTFITIFHKTGRKLNTNYIVCAILTTGHFVL